MGTWALNARIGWVTALSHWTAHVEYVWPKLSLLKSLFCKKWAWVPKVHKGSLTLSSTVHYFFCCVCVCDSICFWGRPTPSHGHFFHPRIILGWFSVLIWYRTTTAETVFPQISKGFMSIQFDPDGEKGSLLSPNTHLFFQVKIPSPPFIRTTPLFMVPMECGNSRQRTHGFD